MSKSNSLYRLSLQPKWTGYQQSLCMYHQNQWLELVRASDWCSEDPGSNPGWISVFFTNEQLCNKYVFSQLLVGFWQHVQSGYWYSVCRGCNKKYLGTLNGDCFTVQNKAFTKSPAWKLNCAYAYVPYPPLQCQRSSGLVGKSTWLVARWPKFKSWLNLSAFFFSRIM